MDSTAQNSNVIDIWSDLQQQSGVNNQGLQDSQSVSNPASGKVFGKPGAARGGEGAYAPESNVQESHWESQKQSESSEEIAESKKVESIANAETQKGFETLKSEEVLKSPEVQKSPEVLKPSSKEAEKKEEKSQPLKEPTKEEGPGKVVDRRTGREKTHRVDENADSTTKFADLKEQDFIERVEQEHIKSIV